MKSNLSGILLSLVILISTLQLAAEPSYCDPKTFYSKEVKTNSKIKRGHTYKLGETLLFGAAVGDSKAKDLIEVSQSQSTAESADKYCTWYYNEGNSAAEENFKHIYLSNPAFLSTTSGPKEYGEKLKDEFANSSTSFLSCITSHKYLAMGCNSQKHRGPTVFGMLLSYSGCSPENAATIVNTVWGLNGVSEKVRLAIIKEGQRQGDLDPEARLRMQKAFGY